MAEPDSEKAKAEGTIKVIAEDVCRKISTSQVVVTLPGACKELIDNALDAGATVIDIRVKNLGLESIEVNDNGSGLRSDDFQQLCKPHATSKLGDISDFRSLATFGFRGEALNALCALSTVTITTRHKSEEIGTRLFFDRNGEIVKQEKCAWPVGTMVTVRNLFEPLPVRRKEFERTSKKDFTKLLVSVQAFALSRTDVRFCVTSFSNGKRHQALLSPGGNASIKDVILSLFGTLSNRGHILEIVRSEPDEAVSSLYSVPTGASYQDIRLSGYVSSCEHGQGRCATDRQFIYFNMRPVSYPKVCRVANEVYQQYNAGKYCMLILFVEVPADLIDVNVSPDKQCIFFEREKELFALLRSSLLATFAPLLGRTESVPSSKAWQNAKLGKFSQSQEADQSQSNDAADCGTAAEASSNSHVFLKPDLPKRVTAVITYAPNAPSKTEHVIRKRPASSDVSSSDEAYAKRTATNSLEQFAFRVVPHVSSDTTAASIADDVPSNSGIAGAVGSAIKRQNVAGDDAPLSIALSKLVERTTKSDLILPICEDEDFSNSDSESHRTKSSVENLLNYESSSLKDQKHLGSSNDGSVYSGRTRTQQKILFSMLSLKQRMENLRLTSSSKAEKEKSKSSVHRASFIALDSRTAENELTAHITKEDFDQMKIVGQFNKGFIITQLRGDLFIVDQHASDEKFNFERFQKKARIQSQALLRPLPLGLGAFEESLLRDHLEIFNYNGFEFQINEDADPGHRVMLTSIPVLHNWQFNTSDIEEMLSVLREFPGTMYRPAKLRKLFAMRACRKSVMIGTALSVSKMEKIVQHLGGLDHPWNCPHGRPTLRHLCSLEAKSSTEGTSLTKVNDIELKHPSGGPEVQMSGETPRHDVGEAEAK